MNSLPDDDILKVARLARLKLTPEELHCFGGQLANLLDYVRTLNEVDVSQVEPMAHVADLANVLRPDEPTPSLTREEALQNAPRTDGRFFLVPQILEGA